MPDPSRQMAIDDFTAVEKTSALTHADSMDAITSKVGDLVVTRLNS